MSPKIEITNDWMGIIGEIRLAATQHVNRVVPLNAYVKFAQRRGYKCTDLYDEAAKEDKSVDAMKRARRQLGESKELDVIVEDRRSSGGGILVGCLVYNPDHQPTVGPDQVI